MPRSGGQVVFSIDWNPRSTQHREIAQILGAHQTAATWIAGTSQIAIPQGISEADDVAVVVPAREQDDLGQILRQQIHIIEADHRRATTASLQGQLVPRGLLADLGISILRRGENGLASSKGFYCPPPGLKLPARGWWVQRGLDFAINRALRKVVQSGQVLHLQIAAEDFQSAADTKALDRILATIRPLHEREKLEMGPLSRLVSRLRRAEGQPQRSVLRAA